MEGFPEQELGGDSEVVWNRKERGGGFLSPLCFLEPCEQQISSPL